MRKSKRTLELEAEVSRLREENTVLRWAMRDMRERGNMAPESYVAIKRPRYGYIIARTDEYGIPVYHFNPEDRPRVQEEFRQLWALNKSSEILDVALREARA